MIVKLLEWNQGWEEEWQDRMPTRGFEWNIYPLRPEEIADTARAWPSNSLLTVVGGGEQEGEV